MADFNYFLNRQGIQGRKGDKGDAGFTPTISVSEQTLNSYKLKITNEYNEFETPNLIGNLGVTDNGGTYLRYDPATGTVSTGEIDGATTEVVGGVRKSTDADLTNLSADTVVTPANVADMLPLLLEAGTDNVTITQDEATSKTKISVEGGSSGGATINDSTTSTTSVWSSSKTNTEISTVANKVDNLTGEITDLTGRVTTNEADISAIKTGKQNKLTAGANVTLTDLSDGTVRIDATGGGGTGDIPIATTTTAGKVKPDGTTITITDDGTISAVGGGSGGAVINDSTTTTTSVWSSSKTNTEITTVANEVAQVQGDVSTLKTDVSGLKTDVSGLKTDVQNALTGTSDQTFDVSSISTKPVFTKRWKFRSAPDVYQQVRMYQSGIVFDDLCANTLKVKPSISGNSIIGGLQLDFKNNYGKISTNGSSSDKLVLKGGSGQEIIIGSGAPKVNIGNYPASQTLHPILTSYNTKAGDGISIITEGDNVTISATGGGGSAPANMVTTDTAQDITANKTFYGEIRVGADNNYATLAKFSKEALVSGNSTLSEHIDLGEADFVVQGNLGKKVYETDKYVYKKYINVDDLSDNQIAMDNTISSQVAHMAMPSDKYIDLTLGASGATYTAPADGWVQVIGASTAVGGFVEIINRVIDFTYVGALAQQYTRGFCPVVKNTTYIVNYQNFRTDSFKFIYSVGSQPSS